MHAPNLYQHFCLDPQENSTALGVAVASRDAQLANRGIPESDERRRAAMTCYSVLSNDTRRAAYDEALRKNYPVTWDELEYLGNFGYWPREHQVWAEPHTPASVPPVSAAPEPAAWEKPLPKPPVAQAAAESPFNQPYDPLVNPRHNAAYPVLGRPTGMVNYQDAQHRVTRDTRLAIAVLDVFIASVISGALAYPLSALAWHPSHHVSGAAFTSLWTVVWVLYMVLPEVYLGGSVGKLIFGYEVRDVNTHKRLTLVQSIKRNWFRLVQLIPGIGHLVGVIGALVAINSVKDENALRGLHDRFADAEVVKKLPH